MLDKTPKFLPHSLQFSPPKKHGNSPQKETFWNYLGMHSRGTKQKKVERPEPYTIKGSYCTQSQLKRKNKTANENNKLSIPQIKTNGDLCDYLMLEHFKSSKMHNSTLNSAIICSVPKCLPRKRSTLSYFNKWREWEVINKINTMVQNPKTKGENGFFFL